MSISFEQKTKNKMSVLWTDENTLIQYNVGTITNSLCKFNGLRIDELQEIINKLEELQNANT